jgi:glycosyltransferase involved in cell wall biosynthesis
MPARNPTAASLPLISVVTPTLNQAQYIAATVHSVMDQGYPNLEYIILDGGSTDETHGVLQRLKAQYGDALQVVVEPGLRQVPAVNKGLAMAKGDILAYINSDDLYLPGAFRAVAYAFSVKPTARWLTAPSLFFGESLQIPRIMSSRVPPSDITRWLHANHACQPSTFWRSDVWREFGGFPDNFRYRFDHAYWLKFIVKGYYPIFLRCPLSAYRLHPTSFTCSVPHLFREEMEKIRAEWAPKLSRRQRRRLAGLIRTAGAEKIEEDALEQARHGQKPEAVKKWLGAIQHSPCILLHLRTYLTLRRLFFPKPDPDLLH